MSSSSITLFFAQATNAAAGAASTPGATDATAPQGPPCDIHLLFVGMIYFGLLRPQSQAKKKAEETSRPPRPATRS